MVWNKSLCPCNPLFSLEIDPQLLVLKDWHCEASLALEALWYFPSLFALSLIHSWAHSCAGYFCKWFAAYKPGPGTAALHLGGQSAKRYSIPSPVTLVAPNWKARQSWGEDAETGRSELSSTFYQNWDAFLKARIVGQRCPGRSEYLPSPSLLYIINALGHWPNLQPQVLQLLVEQSPDPNLTLL